VPSVWESGRRLEELTVGKSRAWTMLNFEGWRCLDCRLFGMLVNSAWSGDERFGQVEEDLQ